MCDGVVVSGRRWLVDGNNLMGSRPDGWWRDRGRAMADLAARLEAFAHAGGEEVAVVFDGAPKELDPSPSAATVEFAGAGGGVSADDVIAARARADRDPASLTVVTSDRELAGRVRACGGLVMGAGSFQARLDETVPNRR